MMGHQAANPSEEGEEEPLLAFRFINNNSGIALILMIKEDRTKKKDFQDRLDSASNIEYVQYSPRHTGFLLNLKTVMHSDEGVETSALLCYFQGQDSWFRAILPFRPYFYVLVEEQGQQQFLVQLQRSEYKAASVCVVDKVDLQMPGHLGGFLRRCIKVSFHNTIDLNQARNRLRGMINKARVNKERYQRTKLKEDLLLDIREYDVMFNARVCIDEGVRVGRWYQIQVSNGYISRIRDLKRDQRPTIKIMAFDIQTSKKPLRFPDAESDQIMMISVMEQDEATLIINSGFCGGRVQDFVYCPEEKHQFRTNVLVYQQPSQKSAILKFFELIRKSKVKVITSFNGDRFDWPFIQRRCEVLGLSFQDSGIFREEEEFFGRAICHLDCFYWVERDAYLPQGSHGLKAVCRAKLDYEPVQIDPQLMTGLCQTETKKMAIYAVSDAVATFYLYMKHIHDFIFALCTIIPLSPDEVLRRGSGTLCEHLLMAEANSRNIIFPNKKLQEKEKFFEGHLLDSQTYIGGRVQCLEAGVFRKDIPTKFDLDPHGYELLIQHFEQVLEFAVRAETKGEAGLADIVNKQLLCQEIVPKLQHFKDHPKGQMLPLIYHLDVAAMYPNIILTNRLQPVSVVNESICSSCPFNHPQNNCKRYLQWQWRGQYFPLKKAQYEKIKIGIGLGEEGKKSKEEGQLKSHFQEQDKALRKRVKDYCQANYKCQHVTKVLLKKDIVCMRQNSFYVDTVRAFRDRRYEFKAKVKVQKSKFNKCKACDNVPGMELAQKMMAVYESLQLAHKIILNSFYGYVMRKGARWYSMEMAAMVTHVGSSIINQAKIWVNAIGLPLELDTDGIWLLLPEGFPQNLKVQLKDGRALNLSYPCHVLNHLIHQKYKNTQYQRLLDENEFAYETTTEMSIEFEIDGPYRAMIIPAAKEKGKMLKKRYVVFKDNGKISELKGFQIKRRGQLKIIKKFQEQIFSSFLHGSTLQELYSACSTTAKKWVLLTTLKGEGYSDAQLLDFLEESRVLSRDVSDYDMSKGLALTTAKRLDQFLGGQFIAGKGKGIKCQYLIAKYPLNTPVTQRAVPKLIFSAEQQTKVAHLRKWLRVDQDFSDLRRLLDWEYYFERISTQVQKIVVIPAYMQNVKIPLDEVPPPQWIIKSKTQEHQQKFQTKLSNFFKPVQKSAALPQQFSSKKDLITPIKFLTESAAPFEKVAQAVHSNPFNPRTEFSKWLAHQKKIWSGPRLGTSLSSMFRQQDSDIFSSKWQVVQLVQTGKGQFKLWIVYKQSIISVDIEAHRVFYQAVQSGGRHHKKSPHNRNQGLLEWKLTQHEFQQHVLKYQCLSRPGKQIYQTKVPLKFKLLSSLGNCCSTSKGVKIGPSGKLRNQDLFSVMNEGSFYLQCLGQLGVIQVLSCRSLSNQMWLCVDRRRKLILVSLVYRLGQKMLTVKKVKQALELTQQPFDIQIQVYSSPHQCLSDLDRLFSKNAALVLWSSHLPVAEARVLGALNLQLNCPVVQVQAAEGVQANSMDWQQKCLSALAMHQNCLNHFLNEVLQKSRFSRLPLGNQMTPLETLDLLYSRKLTKHNAVWWFEEFNGKTLQTHELEINNRGFYNCVCMQMQVNNLTINALLFSDVFCDDLETGFLMSQSKSRYVSEDEGIEAIVLSFKLLKQLVQDLVDDVQKRESQQADLLLQNFNKWISDSSRPFYDPLLHLTIHKAKKKCFMDLLHKLQNLGAKIIQADFKKIVFTSSHFTCDQAKSSCAFIFNECFSKYQHFKYVSFYHSNLWLCYFQYDYNNYCGLLQNQDYVTNFDVLLPLPEMIQQNVKGFVLKYCEDLMRLREEVNPRLKDFKVLFVQNARDYLVQEFQCKLKKVVAQTKEDFQNANKLCLIDPQSQDSDEEQQEDDSINSFVVQERDRLRPPKKSFLSIIQKWLPPPRLRFTHRHLSENSTLELVKFLFDILSVDDSYDALCQTLQQMRKSIIKQQFGLDPIGCQELFKWRRHKYQVHCEKCAFSYFITLGVQSNGCTSCQHPLPQQCLVGIVDRLLQSQLVGLQTRDLYCRKCSRVRRQLLQESCGCGGQWQSRGDESLQWLVHSGDVSQQTKQVLTVLGYME